MSGVPHANDGSVPWDVFVSHSHADEARAAAIASALTEAGMRVFRAIGALDPFTSISDSVLRALRNSRVLLACYSAGYPTRSACQYEFATAYLTGQAEGDPLRRVLAVNLERTVDHIEPRHLRDVLLPPIQSIPGSLADVVKAVAGRVAAIPGVMGEVRERPPQWVTGTAVHPPNEFVGRWRELWWLHSALHPHVGPLTSQPTAPVVVVHGPIGIGKTALAAQYVRRFGAAFPGGIVWRSAHQPAPASPGAQRECLWVLDDADGDPEQVADHLPSDPGTPCLVLTRDPRLARLGNALALDDLDGHESAQLFTAHGLTADSVALRRITDATAGSPELRSRVAELAATSGIDVALTTLHRPVSPLLAPLAERLARAMHAVGDTGWDLLRVLAAAAPTAVSILHIADILGSLHGTDRLREFAPVQHTVTELLAHGVVPARPDAVELKLAASVVLALRQLDADPYRADAVRARTIQTLIQPRTTGPSVPARRAGSSWNDEQARAAHQIRSELIHRVTGNPLADGEGSLRDALSSLHELLKTARSVYGNLPPGSLHKAPSGADLSTLVNHLINDVLRSRLTHWHVELAAHEDVRPDGVSRIEHERRWPHNRKLREELLLIHREALDIADQLALIADETG
ncbi:TIR domain-containing protein [Saccharomonospora sp. NPDC046836]|uniref:TIR domain-containing protein n=1 Tax=Saccharomonospora sp. NPDC046836 TaxID=3156921 RepID=UPI0033E59E81